jgi:hypothetical protein
VNGDDFALLLIGLVLFALSDLWLIRWAVARAVVKALETHYPINPCGGIVETGLCGLPFEHDGPCR